MDPKTGGVLLEVHDLIWTFSTLNVNQVIYSMMCFFNGASVDLTDPLPGSGHSSLVQRHPALLGHRQVHPHCRHSSGLQVRDQSQPQRKDQ